MGRPGSTVQFGWQGKAPASAALQLVNKGWQPGLRWAYEVKAPGNVDCTMGVPEVTRPIGEWLRAGFVPVEVLKEIERSAKKSEPAKKEPWDKNATPAEPPSKADKKMFEKVRPRFIAPANLFERGAGRDCCAF